MKIPSITAAIPALAALACLLSRAPGIIRAAANPQGARQFLDYIKMPATAALLERYGFVLPGKEKP